MAGDVSAGSDGRSGRRARRAASSADDGRARGAVSEPRRFLDALTAPDALAAFRVWRAARGGARLPQLRDFVPQRLPPRTLPWLLLYRVDAEGELVYALIGEEMLHLFRSNPKGQRVLGYADPAERAARLAVIRQSMRTGLPVWYEGPLLFENKAHLPVGRLCLPVAAGTQEACLMLYFPRTDLPRPRLAPGAPTPFDMTDLVWCSAAELAEDGAAGR